MSRYNAPEPGVVGRRIRVGRHPCADSKALAVVFAAKEGSSPYAPLGQPRFSRIETFFPFYSLRIPATEKRVSVRVVPVRNPLPDIACDVVEAVVIRWIAANRS